MSEEPVVILTLVAGLDARPCLESLLQTGHKEFIISFGEGVAPSMAGTLSQRANVTVIPAPPSLPERAQAGPEPPLHLLVLRHALDLLGAGRRFAGLVPDLLVQAPLRAAWSEARPVPFGLALPRWRPDRLESLNSKLILGHASPAVQQELGLVAADVRRGRPATAAAPAPINDWRKDRRFMGGMLYPMALPGATGLRPSECDNPMGAPPPGAAGKREGKSPERVAGVHEPRR